ncbi:ribonuclease H [Candidatus Kaiserbacteria bacterium CG10_big_fil_rev_8_21_14_0_10_49_17]|uniref:Ribonuclease H n=1 Tax=Candidatus Kaiserbacteria bacterium CG10_big_fil_rev_8_21_14_0_10_49_17 TaxID=1974609 RepID=A0A2M6WEE3_9BACT|nr:MAG: ribonuclease H [Candidatus Kaiserbacteria bacterium CG10_big_fil_rev_8_21_14_0_10_49_17]
MSKPEIIIYTDGGARNNPGPAGAGVHIEDAHGKVLAEVSQYLGERTNNWAEYEAVALALAKAKKLGLAGKKVEVRMDSELVAKQLNGEYQIKEESLHSQFVKVHNFTVKDFKNINFVHVRREQNAKADALANRAMDNGR